MDLPRSLLLVKRRSTGRSCPAISSFSYEHDPTPSPYHVLPVGCPSLQRQKALFRRLCPGEGEERRFAPVMLRRLRKLGIDKTNPNDLTEEEVHRFVRCVFCMCRCMHGRVKPRREGGCWTPSHVGLG